MMLASKGHSARRFGNSGDFSPACIWPSSPLTSMRTSHSTIHLASPLCGGLPIYRSMQTATSGAHGDGPRSMMIHDNGPRSISMYGHRELTQQGRQVDCRRECLDSTRYTVRIEMTMSSAFTRVTSGPDLLQKLHGHASTRKAKCRFPRSRASL